MPRTQFRFLHLDVFTATPFEGNQLAVLPDARGLSSAEMQAIAKEMAFSETTFVLPPEDGQSDVRMRIFTPASELPMAGHPVIGSTFALAHEQVIATGRSRFVFGLGVGPLNVDMEWRGADLHFAWMTQLAPVFGAPMSNLAGMADALGMERSDIESTRLPVQSVSCGVPFLLVPVATRRAVDQAELNIRAFHAFFRDAGVKGLPVFFFSSEPGSDGATVYSRMFAPDDGMLEDPATGGASGPLGCYLVKHGVVTREQAGKMLSLQGVKMGRPSRIHIAIETNGDEISRVQVGGQSVLVAEGSLRV